jgi:hypothetical protein
VCTPEIEDWWGGGTVSADGVAIDTATRIFGLPAIVVILIGGALLLRAGVAWLVDRPRRRSRIGFV